MPRTFQEHLYSAKEGDELAVRELIEAPRAPLSLISVEVVGVVLSIRGNLAQLREETWQIGTPVDHGSLDSINGFRGLIPVQGVADMVRANRQMDSNFWKYRDHALELTSKPSSVAVATANQTLQELIANRAKYDIKEFWELVEQAKLREIRTLGEAGRNSHANQVRASRALQQDRLIIELVRESLLKLLGLHCERVITHEQFKNIFLSIHNPWDLTIPLQGQLQLVDNFAGLTQKEIALLGLFSSPNKLYKPIQNGYIVDEKVASRLRAAAEFIDSLAAQPKALPRKK